MRELTRGILITLEGIDGSGKSTLAHSLAAQLRQYNLPVLLTKEPGGSTLGKELRTILQHQQEAVSPIAEYLLFAADRAEHFAKLIIPALANQSIVISDRMGDSSIAYQGYGRGLDIAMIMSINNWAMQTLQPDLVFYLKLDPAIAQQRIKVRNQGLTTFEQEHVSFTKRLADGFDTLFTGRTNVITLDATLSMDDLKLQALKELMTWIRTNNLLR
jgi:dTMP kinase